METHTIAYSKSHRPCGKVQARGKIDDEANCLSTGDGCGNQSTQNFVFTKGEDMTKEQEERILKLASVDNQSRKDHVANGTVPDVEIAVEEGKCIATRHLGRNGGLVSDIASTVQVAEIPHVTCKEEDMNPESQKLAAEEVKLIAQKTRPNDIIEISLNPNGDIRPHRTDVKKSGLSELNVNHTDNQSHTVSASHPPKIYSDTDIRIRKLTPLECERLMSWPDNWTKYGTDENGKTYELSNSARYKACGNGIVSNIPKALLDHVTGSEQGLRVFSTFAGVDGSGLYLEFPKYIKVGFSEFDPQSKAQHAANVLRYHYPNVPNLGDITKVDVSEVPDHDIIFISAPCQSFSAAGQNLGIEDTRGTLFYETARIMEAKKPRYFIFENVKGLLSKKHERTFEIMCEVYSSLGYEIDFELINAKHWNVAQNRERVFMIGRLK